MNLAFYTTLFFLIILTPANATDIKELRKLYYQATEKEEHADKFLQVMENMTAKSDPLLLCYLGMANMLQASYSFNPYNKLVFFNKGKKMIEQALTAAPQHMEIRFMRFCIQTNAPVFLGYNSNVDEDKAYILKSWKDLKDIDLKEKIKAYLLESNACNVSEKLILK